MYDVDVLACMCVGMGIRYVGVTGVTGFKRLSRPRQSLAVWSFHATVLPVVSLALVPVWLLHVYHDTGLVCMCALFVVINGGVRMANAKQPTPRDREKGAKDHDGGAMDEYNTQDADVA